ncbi:signal peptidase I [Bacillus oleivorans]|uniref:Signal peptidase I n=1 Tax=Bacillus oleivorans TaxID=1448271 RepID=A0A285CR44_9BACI|nr:signal peptidase I [Bacillus oleivorans]SNX70050.1 signal peptidase I [Bacillus oleivorans]
METLKKESIEWLKALGIGLVIFVFIRTFLFSSYVVEGESMMPTLEEGNKLVVNKIGYTLGSIDRFDVIVFHANEEEDYVKRVIGLPGDQIVYENDQLFINGKAVEEPYLTNYRKTASPGQPLTGDFSLAELWKTETVPEGMLFVLGDNRLESWDSRHFGFVPIDKVVGEVNLRYWPLSEVDTSF